MAALYLMTYDLHRQRDYTRLYDLMDTFKAERLLESVWVAYLRGPAETIRDLMVETLDGDDSVAVIEVKPGSEWASTRAQKGGTDLLWRFVPNRF